MSQAATKMSVVGLGVWHTGHKASSRSKNVDVQPHWMTYY